MSWNVHQEQFFIGGRWVAPALPKFLDVIDPASEEPVARIAAGSSVDVDRAVTAAREAFPSFSQTSRQERLALLKRILEALRARAAEFAEAVVREMGATRSLAVHGQVVAGIEHLRITIEVLEQAQFERWIGKTKVLNEPIGVCGLITAWNWPINLVACKLAPALASGCTVVLKPSELAPLDALLFAEVMEEAQTPPGVFNLINGTGSEVGNAMSAHAGIDMISFTGSTATGIAISQRSASTVKRLTLELGGKSANIILPDADLRESVVKGVRACFVNNGQSCSAPTRMLVPQEHMAAAAHYAAEVANSYRVGMPDAEGVDLGPVANGASFERIQRYLKSGVAEGARVAAGGVGRPAGLSRGYFVRPTIFADVTPAMTIAREEIFGPVLVIIPYRDEADAIQIANDTEYGLAGYVQSRDEARAKRVASQLRAGTIEINYAGHDFAAPFGGYKRSGNGREWGEYGLQEYLETKSVMGWS